MAQRLPLVLVNNTPTNLPATDELPNAALPTNPILKGLQAMRPPVGATADRSGTPTAGDFRYNTTLGCHEGYTPDGWVACNDIIVAGYRGNVGQATGNSVIAYGNSAPLSTAGTALWSKTLVPLYATSVMEIDFAGMVDCNSSNHPITLAIFRGTTLIAFSIVWGKAAGNPVNIVIKVNDSPGSTAAVTYTCRIGIDTSSATWYFGRSSTATMGGVNSSGWTIREVLP